MIETLGKLDTCRCIQGVCWLDYDMDTEDTKISIHLFLCSHFNSHRALEWSTLFHWCLASAARNLLKNHFKNNSLTALLAALTPFAPSYPVNSRS
jgi:hypothetical protein